MAGKSIVRDIYVSVPRIDESDTPTGTTAYVFAVRPRPSFLASRSGASARSRQMRRRLSMAEPTSLSIEWRDPITSRRYSDPSAFMAVELPRASPFVHEVSRTYAECRALYRQLLAFTDCRSMETCGCILGSCPFWSMHAVLKALPFPRRSLLSLHWTHKSITHHRKVAFNQFMASLVHHFQLYREDFFLDRVSSTEFHGCKVIGAIEAFLALTDDVVERFRVAEHRQQLKMNLQGWQSDRKNLYFGDEDEDRGSISSGDMGDDDGFAANEPTRNVVASSRARDTHFDTMGVDVDEILRELTLAGDHPQRREGVE